MTQLLHGITETTITTGIGTLSLGGAVPGAVSFSGRYAVGATVPYLIANGTSKEWGIGTVGVGNTLARTTITGTLVSGVYTAGGAPITLVGASQVEAVQHEGNDFQTSMAAHVIAVSPHGSTYTTPAQAASAAPVQTVAGRTGTVTLAPADVVGFNAAASAVATTLVSTFTALPAAGVSGVLYVTLDTGYIWRWNGTAYVGAPFTIDASGNPILPNLPNNSYADSLILGLGAGASWAHVLGHYECFIGNNAGQHVTTGIINTFIMAGSAMTTGNYNVGIGADAMRATPSGDNNTAIGVDAFQGVDVTQVAFSNGTAIGRLAGAMNAVNDACCIGAYAGQYATTGLNNIMVGTYAGRNLTTANHCTSIGWQAMGGGNLLNNTGDDNTAIGYWAGYNLLGQQNTAIGSQAAYNLALYGDKNTCIGFQAGWTGTGMYANTFIGNSAGYSNTGNYNVGIGFQAGPATSAIANSICIGTFAQANATSQCVIGGANAAGVITDMYLGQGITYATATGITIHATGGSGTNNVGGNMTLAAGIGTGAAAASKILFNVPVVGPTGTTPQALATMLTVSSTGITVGSPTLISSSVALTNGAGTAIATLTNAPVATNPTKWIPINDNGTTRYIPAW